MPFSGAQKAGIAALGGIQGGAQDLEILIACFPGSQKGWHALAIDICLRNNNEKLHGSLHTSQFPTLGKPP